MDTEDGRGFIKHLAYYIRTHEKALASSLLSQRQTRRHSTSTASLSSASGAWGSPRRDSANGIRPATSSGFLSPFPLGRSSKTIKPPRLFLTPNQLYYLLVRFEELGVSTGPLNIRVEDLHAQTPSSNYMSFLAHAPSSNVRDTDADSIHSVVSTRGTASSISSLWTHFSLSGSAAARAEKQDAAAREDIRYLYSSMTKIPCVKLSVDSRLRPIAGFEEFPFDTAIPIHVFKNLSELEISDIDFRSVYGWDRLAEQLRVMVVKRASLEDVTELLTKIVLDDMDQRRHGSSKTPSTPISAFSSHNPYRRSGDWMGSFKESDSPTRDGRPRSSGASRSPKTRAADIRKGDTKPRMRSVSPQQFGQAPQQSSVHSQPGPAPRHRRSSHSSNSSLINGTPRQSASSLSLMTQLPPYKWRFLRHLSIADNGLTCLTAEALQPVADTLQSLDLSSNLFAEIPECLATLASLRALNMSNCMIDSIRSLAQHPLPVITVLNLKANRIPSLVGIEKLVSLQRLDVRDNRLTDPDEVARLTCIPEFYDLYIKGNPFSKTHLNYRVTLFNVFRRAPVFHDDINIDSEKPTFGERRQLVDRATEIAFTPAFQSHDETDQGILRDVDLASQSVMRPTASDDSSANLEPADLSSQRKGTHKAAKRRVIDLAEAHTHATRATSKVTVSPQATLRGTNTATQSREPGKEHRSSAQPVQASLARVDESETASILKSSEIPAGDFVDALGQSSDLYRQRIDALKMDHGNAWLTAIENIGGVQQTSIGASTSSPPVATVFAAQNATATIAAGSEV